MTHRLTWVDLPSAVRSRIEGLLGGPVVTTRSCAGGFSPSTAEVVTTADGASLFVKAVRDADNPGSVALNRREAAALARIPPSAPVPPLVAAFDHEDWFVLVTGAAPGRMPDEPWRPEQLRAVLTALDRLQAATTPCPVPGIPTVPESLGPDLRGFDRIAADPPADLDPWYADRLPALREASERGIAALAGDTLCHADVRRDNLILDADGSVAFVDWAHASVGSRTADALQLLSSVEDPRGALGVDGAVDSLMAAHDLDPSVATDVLTGILGFFVDAARLESTLPGLTAHRTARRDSLAPLVRRRWEREGR